MRKLEKSLLLALAIGDGSLSKNDNSLKGRLYLAHGFKQLEYLKHKQQLLESILHKSLKIYKTTSKHGITYRLAVSHKYFRVLRNVLYSNGVKTITPTVLSRLNTKGLAYWYMDDGSLYPKKHNGKIHAFELVLSVYGTKKECEDIVEWLLATYDIKAGLKYNKGKYSIRMGTKEAKKFISLIDPYILPMFKYKTSFQK